MNASVRVAAGHLRSLARDLLTAAPVPPACDGTFATVITAAGISASVPPDDHIARAESFCTACTACTALRVSGPEAVVPGEPAARTRAERPTEGAPVRAEPDAPSGSAFRPAPPSGRRSRCGRSAAFLIGTAVISFAACCASRESKDGHPRKE
ncbi:hypothetical protein [Nonomuraea sp. NPDC049309]|uniref:hypothetical protein n=1 Tax=Nonomuraea sp. NPDC049309 TaxID=3364350 RepID=UPI00371207FE